METSKRALGLLSLTLILVSFSQCASTQKLQKKSPTKFGETYFQKWVSGVAQGPSGLNIFIEVLDDNIKLDSVYFREKAAKFEVKPANTTLFIGRFISEFNKNKDMIISSDSNQEYGNKVPEIPKTIPFELNYDECVISYIVGNKTKYFKLENIEERQSDKIPMSPNQNND